MQFLLRNDTMTAEFLVAILCFESSMVVMFFAFVVHLSAH